MTPQERTVQLEKLKFALQSHLPAGLIEDISFGADQYLDDVVTLTLRGFVWAEDVGKEQIRYPADWWQAFKERWFPAWALKRWPVQYHKVILDVKATYPDFRPSMPDHSPIYRVIKNDWGIVIGRGE